MLTKAAATSRDVLLAFVDGVILAEPLLIRLWRETGLSLTQLRVLRIVRDEPSYPRAIAAAAGLASPSATRVLARLEDRGLITRAIDPDDRRRIVVRITDAGTELLAKHSVWRSSVFQQAAEEMDPDARAEFVRVLGAYNQRVRRLQAMSDVAGVGAEA